jgi:branched-chain amino acid transport system substrate-binding protein
LAIAPIANREKVIILSPGASNPAITNAGDYVFRNWPSDALQGEVDAHVASDTLEWKNIAILRINNDYGAGLDSVFRKNINAGARIVADETYEKGSNDFRTQLLKIRDANADGVYVLSYPEELPVIFRQAKEINLNKTFLGTETFESQQLIENVGDIANGAIYTFPRTPDSSVQVVGNFRRKYLAKFGKPWGTPGDAAYDAIYMLVNGIGQEKNDPEKVKQYLYEIKDYNGASGTVTIDKNGDAIKSFDVKIIQDKTFRKR